MSYKRALLYATLVLAVPLPALALEGGSAGRGLEVQASLNGCAVADGSIVCTIDTSFGGMEDAEYYTASVTAPDGSVTDFGMVGEAGGGATSLSVPYTGNGTYTVTVSAWGYDERGKAGVVRSEDAGAGGERGAETGEEPEAVETPPQEAPAEETPTTPAPVEPPEEPPEPCPDPTVQPPSGGPVAGGAQGAEAPAVEPSEVTPAPCPPPEEPEPAPPPAP